MHKSRLYCIFSVHLNLRVNWFIPQLVRTRDPIAFLYIPLHSASLLISMAVAGEALFGAFPGAAPPHVCRPTALYTLRNTEQVVYW